MSKAARPKKTASKDWSAAYIGYRLKEAGWTFSKLSKHHGYKARNTAHRAVEVPWPKGERMIAEAIGVPPETIWPSRYAARSERLRILGHDLKARPGNSSSEVHNDGEGKA